MVLGWQNSDIRGLAHAGLATRRGHVPSDPCPLKISLGLHPGQDPRCLQEICRPVFRIASRPPTHPAQLTRPPVLVFHKVLRRILKILSDSQQVESCPQLAHKDSDYNISSAQRWKKCHHRSVRTLGWRKGALGPMS